MGIRYSDLPDFFVEGEHSIPKTNFRIKRLDEFITVCKGVKDLYKKRGIWFRGVGKEQYELIPGLYRIKKILEFGDIKKIAEIENDVLTRFFKSIIPIC